MTRKRRIRYQVACSLDGYIAGPNGQCDWIVPDPDIDFPALFAEFDTLLMGRRTFESMTEMFPGFDVFVFSRSLQQKDYPEVTVVNERAKETLEELRQRPGKDIWLFGGGELFRSLLELDCVDGGSWGPDPFARRCCGWQSRPADVGGRGRSLPSGGHIPSAKFGLCQGTAHNPYGDASTHNAGGE